MDREGQQRGELGAVGAVLVAGDEEARQRARFVGAVADVVGGDLRVEVRGVAVARGEQRTLGKIRGRVEAVPEVAPDRDVAFARVAVRLDRADGGRGGRVERDLVAVDDDRRAGRAVVDRVVAGRAAVVVEAAVLERDADAEVVPFDVAACRLDVAHRGRALGGVAAAGPVRLQTVRRALLSRREAGSRHGDDAGQRRHPPVHPSTLHGQISTRCPNPPGDHTIAPLRRGSENDKEKVNPPSQESNAIWQRLAFAQENPPARGRGVRGFLTGADRRVSSSSCRAGSRGRRR